MEGHVVMPMMEHSDVLENRRTSGKMRQFAWPVLALLVSGGHTELILSESFGAYRRIGETRDDAAGECFDKTARLLDLPYPGGPEISRLAAEARAEGIVDDIKLTPPMRNSKEYDFSFSGLKTEVRKLVETLSPITNDRKKRIALAIENAITEALAAKAVRAAEEFGARTVVLGGGVSANDYLRAEIDRRLRRYDDTMVLLAPPSPLATDNALMICLAGYFHALKGEFAPLHALAACGNLTLGNPYKKPAPK